MNHYELVVATYLARRGIEHRRVDETVRPRRGDGDAPSVKNVDFIVPVAPGAPDGTPGLLVEVKGRKFTAKRRFENWVTADDLAALAYWEAVFGDDYRALLCFAYWLADPVAPGVAWSPTTLDHRRYGLAAILRSGYESNMRQRSPRWQTYTIPRGRFVQLIRPLEAFLPAPPDRLGGEDLPDRAPPEA